MRREVFSPGGSAGRAGASVGFCAGQTGGFFEKQVLPVLRADCMGCHKAGRAAGGLALDSSRAALLKGGAKGPAVVPGKPEKSPLYTYRRTIVRPSRRDAARRPAACPAQQRAVDQELDRAGRRLARRA